MSGPTVPSPSQAIEFLQLLQHLKTQKRTGWVKCGVQGPESIADHMYRMGMMALLVQGTAFDYAKCIKLALVHDVAEAIVGDITPHCGISDEDKYQLEAEAVARLKSVLGGELEALWHEYEQGESEEAKLLEMILQATEYEQAQGKVLQQFFDSTASKWRTDLGRSWAEEIYRSCELTLNGTRHLISVSSTPDSLEVEVEEPEAVQFWRGRFAASYLEEITSKTGSFKKFAVFVRMLASALRRESDSVYVDLLTYSDLELLKSQRARTSEGGLAQASAAAQAAGVTGAAQQRAPASAQNKRYLILTYAAEFDRVHYPLPLQPEDSPDPQRLKAIIRQLRAQAGSAGGSKGASAHGRRSGGGALLPPELRALREENTSLKAQVRALEAQAQAGGTSLAADVQQLAADAQETVADLRSMRKERDALLLRAQQAEAALEGERNLHRRELRRRAKEAADLGAELGATKDQIRELRLKCRELTQELDMAQRRAKVAVLSADYLGRPGRAAPPPARAAPGSRGATPNSRGVSPGRPAYRSSSRDASPAAARGRGPPPPAQPLRSRSADVSRSSSRPSSHPSSRPASAGRFDPSEYVRQKREREREAAQRLNELRRQGRMQSPGRAASLPRSRPGSVPSSRDATPQRSRVSSRDPSADRARGSWDRGELVRSTQRLRAAMATTQAGGGFPTRDQRSSSPGRALQEVKARLQSYAAKGGSGGRGVGVAGGREGGLIPAVRPAAAAGREPAAQQRPVAAAGQQQGQQQQRVAGGGGSGNTYADASAEIQDIDARLQSLQNFLRAAKGGQAARSPVQA
eukprot:scaffold8.g1459.t1